MSRTKVVRDLIGELDSAVFVEGPPPSTGSGFGALFVSDGSASLNKNELYFVDDSGSPISLGDISGPATSTDNAVALWDGTDGDLLKDSPLVITEHSFGGQEIVALSGLSSSADLSLVVAPKGMGAIFAAIPDGGDGGNARGSYAVDLQLFRGSANHVASGVGSFLGAGLANRASGTFSAIVGSLDCVASGAYSLAHGSGSVASGEGSVAVGIRPSAAMRGQLALSSGRFASTGDAQSSLLHLFRVTSDDSQVELTLGGASPSPDSRLILPDDTAWIFTASIVAVDVSSGDSAWFEVKGAIHRGSGAGSTQLVGDLHELSGKTLGAADWDATLDADDVNGSLAVLVTGDTGATVRWSCALSVAMVSA